jgi:HK97 family phage portal protein
MAFAKLKNAPANPGRDPFWVQPGYEYQPYRDGWDITRAIQYGLNRSIWVYRCVQTIANNQAKLPMVYRRGNWYDGKIVKGQKLEPLNYKASPYDSSLLFRKRLSQLVLLNRQGVFIEKVYSRSGDLIALYILPPGYTWPIPDAKTFVSAYRVEWPGRSFIDIDPRKVIWIREPHPSEPYLGITPLEAAGLSVETDYYARLYNRNFLANDGRPGGMIVVKGDLNEADRQEIYNRVTGYGPGFSGAGRVGVISSQDGAEFIDLSSTARDMQHKDTQESAKHGILAAFGVPESIFNASGRTWDNADAELNAFWRETMLPHLNMVASAFDDAFDEDPRLFVGFDFQHVPVLEHDIRAKATFALSELTAGAISRDEYREQTGRDAVGASKLYVPQGNTAVADTDDPEFAKNADTAAPAQPGLPGAGPAPTPALDFGGYGATPQPSVGQEDLFGTAFGQDPATLAQDALDRGEVQHPPPPGAPAPPKFAWKSLQFKADGADLSGFMVCVRPPLHIANQLSVAGGEPPDRLHITLVYIPTDNIADPQGVAKALAVATAAFASQAPPFEITLGGVGMFDTPEGRVWWASVDSPNLAEVRSRLLTALDAVGIPYSSTHGWMPHMTLAYGDEAGMPDVPRVTWMADSLACVAGEQDLGAYRLRGGAVDFKRTPIVSAKALHAPRHRSAPALPPARRDLWTATEHSAVAGT